MVLGNCVYEAEAASGKKFLAKVEAMIIAEGTKGVEGLYKLQNGKSQGLALKKDF